MPNELDQLLVLVLFGAIGAAVIEPRALCAETASSVTRPPQSPDPSTYWTEERRRAARPVTPEIHGRPGAEPSETSPVPTGPSTGAGPEAPVVEPDAPTPSKR